MAKAPDMKVLKLLARPLNYSRPPNSKSLPLGIYLAFSFGQLFYIFVISVSIFYPELVNFSFLESFSSILLYEIRSDEFKILLSKTEPKFVSLFAKFHSLSILLFVLINICFSMFVVAYFVLCGKKLYDLYFEIRLRACHSIRLTKSFNKIQLFLVLFMIVIAWGVWYAPGILGETRRFPANNFGIAIHIMSWMFFIYIFQINFLIFALRLFLRR